MSKSPKYTFRVVEKRNNTWTAEIQRQATAKKKVVSKRETGFASEAEGIEWAEKQLKDIVENHLEKNKRQAAARAQKLIDNPELAEIAEQKRIAKAEKLAKIAALAEQSEEQDTEQIETSMPAIDPKEQAEIDEMLASDESGDKSSEDSVKKFDFELELEEQEQQEIEQKNTNKKSKKVEDSADPFPESATADGSDKINDIYLKK